MQEVEKLSQAEHMLAAIETPQDAIAVKNLADAAHAWAVAAHLETPALNHCTSVKARALKRLAQTVDEGQRAGTIATQSRGGANIRNGILQEDTVHTLPDLGTDFHELHRARELAQLEDEEIETFLAESSAKNKDRTCTDLAKLVRARRRSERIITLAEHRPTIELDDAAGWLGRQEPCDLLITDPPYATDVEDVDAFAASWLPLALDKVKPSGRALVFIGAYPDELRAYLPLLKRGGWGEQVLAWYYPDTLGPSPTHAFKSVWQAILYTWGPDAPRLNGETMTERTTLHQFNMNSGIDGGRQHQWQKPDRLAERLITLASREEDIVLDPFAGTGTFLLAAGHLGRIGRGCEIDPDMLAIAVAGGCLHE